MREDERRRDEESIQKQEQLKRDTLEYQYQLEASLKQQKLKEEMRMKEDMNARNMEFLKNVLTGNEKEKRETQKQNIMTIMSLAGNQVSQMLANPKFMYNVAYASFLIFGAFQITKMSASVFG